MNTGLQPEIIVWIAVILILLIAVIIWAIYKLIAYFRHHYDASLADPQSASIGSSPIEAQGLRDEDSTNVDMVRMGKLAKDQAIQLTLLRGKLPSPRMRYLEPQTDPEAKSSDKVLHESCLGTHQSNKTSVSKIGSMQSVGSRNSYGFEPNTWLIEPVVKQGHKTNNFLSILERLDALEEFDEFEREQERERVRRRRLVEETPQTISSAGIEANSSDETASQTYIGKEATARPDPGTIELSLIRAQNTDQSNTKK